MKTGEIKIVGPSGDPKEEAMASYVRLMRVLQAQIAMKFDMTVGDSLAGTLTSVAAIAEEYGFREELAIVMEKWAELLRSSQPIHIKAEAFGHA